MHLYLSPHPSSPYISRRIVRSRSGGSIWCFMRLFAPVQAQYNPLHRFQLWFGERYAKASDKADLHPVNNSP